jgi:hypothetical protein
VRVVAGRGASAADGAIPAVSWGGEPQFLLFCRLYREKSVGSLRWKRCLIAKAACIPTPRLARVQFTTKLSPIQGYVPCKQPAHRHGEQLLSIVSRGAAPLTRAQSSFSPTQIFDEGTTEEKGENARLSAFVGAIAVGDLVKSTLGPKGMDKILQSAYAADLHLQGCGALTPNR